MKKLSIILFIGAIILSTNYSNAQKNKILSQIAVKKNNYGWIQFKQNKSLNPLSVLKDYKDAFDLQSDDEMQVYKIKNDNLGFTHYRFQQYYKDIPVEGAEYLIHAKNRKAVSGNGKIVKGLNLNVNPEISPEQSIDIAINYVNAALYMWEDERNENMLKRIKKDMNVTYYPDAELVIMDKNFSGISKNYRYAYKVDVFAQKPMSRNYIYVDALTGEVFHTISRIHNTDVPGIAETKYNGTQVIMTDSVSPGLYRLKEASRGDSIVTYDMDEGTNYGNAVDFTDDDNYWDVTVNQDDAAYSAHWGAEMTYDYYFTKFGQNSFDGSGAAIVSYVHYDVDYYNAFWNGIAFTYGDGDGSVSALTPLDIVAHEISHAFTEYSANLVYQYEPGALNESFSDIFGVCVEFYADTFNPDWTMGEDIGEIMRSMSNPKAYGDPDTYLGDNWEFGEFDNGGVHTNSGVQNYWFYLLSEGGSGTNDNGHFYDVTGLGIDIAEEIAYRCLHVYLTTSSEYYDARVASIQAAEDLYGSCSNAVIETANAWYAVGVGYPITDYDLMVVDIESPVTACGLSSAYITVILRYNGCNISLNVNDTIPLGYRVDGGTIINDTIILSATMNGGDSLSFTFTTPADVSTIGIHSIDCWVSFAQDIINFNDTLYGYEFENLLQQNIDVGVVDIIAPVSGCQLSNSENVEIILQFFGCDSLATNTSIAVAYNVDGGSIIRDTIVLDSNIYSYETFNYVFNTPADLSAYQTYIIDSWTEFDIDTLTGNDSLLGYEVKNPQTLWNNTITFEDNTGVVDSFLVSTYEQSDAFVSVTAANTGSYGFQMTGGDDPMSYMDILMDVFMDMDTATIWEDLQIFSSKLCFCVDGRFWSSADLQFDLKQTFSFVYGSPTIDQYLPEASSLRVLVNDNQISEIYNPITELSDPFVTKFLSLNAFAETNFEVCFQSINILSAVSDPLAPLSKGDNVYIDNIIFSGDPISPVANDDSSSTLKNDSVTVNILANDDYPAPAELIVNISQLPLNGNAVLNTDNTVTYIPDIDFVGNDTLNYLICYYEYPALCDYAFVAITVEQDESIKELSQDNNIYIYPNPNNGEFSIEYFSNSSETMYLEIIDLLGRSIQNKSWKVANGKNKINLNLNSQPKGMYIVKVNTKSGVITSLIVFE